MAIKYSIETTPLNRKALKLNYYGIFSLKWGYARSYLLIIFNAILLFQQALANESMPEFLSPSIKTVQFHREGWALSNPVITLNSDQRLSLSFDELGSTVRNLNYTVVLCCKDWNNANLMTTEYLRGIAVNPITNHYFSFNTTFEFIHYQVTIPNQYMQFTRSGNYALVVFEGNNLTNPLLVKHFIVVEPVASINPRITKTALSSIRGAYQEIDFEVNHAGLTINNPMKEIWATIRQNGRRDNTITDLRPIFFRDGLMDFNLTRETLMEGGNEFRHADIRSTRTFSDRVSSIEFIDPFYHATIVTDKPLNPGRYYFNEDLNGRFHIEARNRTDPNVEADYMFVHFRLETGNELKNQHVYLIGALTNWKVDETSRMVFNPLSNGYEKSLLLKQGYYNYQYLTVTTGESKGSVFEIENSFHQTENDYLIIVYFKGSGDRTHRVIAAETFNSLLPQPRQGSFTN